MVVRIGEKRKINLLRLFGSFIMISAFIFLVSSIYNMMWITSILNKQVMYGYDIPIEIHISNVVVQGVITNMSDALGILLTPIAESVFWCGVIVLGMMLFKLGEVMPVKKSVKRRVKKK